MDLVSMVNAIFSSPSNFRRKAKHVSVFYKAANKTLIVNAKRNGVTKTFSIDTSDLPKEIIQDCYNFIYGKQ